MRGQSKACPLIRKIMEGKATLFCDGHGTIAEDIDVDKVDEVAKAHRDDLFCYYAIHVLAKVLVERSTLPRPAEHEQKKS